MKKLTDFRALWLLIPLILLVQIIAGMSERAHAPDWPHERVPQVMPQRPAAQNPQKPAEAAPVKAVPAGAVTIATPQPTLDPPADSLPGIAQGQEPTSEPDQSATGMVTNGTARVPILVYHHISDQNQGTRYYISIQQFKAQMQLLHDQSYTPITMADLVDILEGGTPLPQRPIVLSFDDGNEDIYINAFPVLQSLGFPGVAFVIVGNLGGQDYLGTDQLSEMLADGWEVGSHSMSHADLSAAGVDLGEELNQSLEDLETELGVPVQSFAYPYAVTSESIFQAVENAGYADAACSGWNNTQRLSSRYCLSRREVMPEMDLNAFQKLIEEP